jgi:hypothetical protein
VRWKWGWRGRALFGASVGERECRVHAQEAVQEHLRANWGEFAERERGAEAVQERPRAIWDELSGARNLSACTGSGAGAAAR